MSIIRVAQNMEFANPGSLKADGKNSYKEVFFVETDSQYDGAITVASFSLLPFRTTTFPSGLLSWTSADGPSYYSIPEFDLAARLATKTPTRKGKTSWELECSYEQIDAIENPLLRPVEWSMSFAAFTRIAEKDIFGNRVENSAGMAFNPPIEIDDSRPIVKAVRNEPDFDLPLIRRFKDSINSAPWKGLPARTVKLKQIAPGEKQTENDVDFYAHTYEFELADEFETEEEEEELGWLYEITQAGFYEKVDDADPPFAVITDADGNPVQEPVKLDEDGKILAAGLDPVTKRWHLLKERDFNQLAL